MESKTVNLVGRTIKKLTDAVTDGKYRFPFNTNDKKKASDWIEYMVTIHNTANVSPERLVNYIVFQIYRQKVNVQTGRWKISNLFGEAARLAYEAKYINKSSKNIDFYINRWLDGLGLSRVELVRILAPKQINSMNKYVFMESEESIKRRFINTENGLLLCQYATTGWSPFSPTCNRCENVEKCIPITEKKYPELVRIRKERYGKKQ